LGSHRIERFAAAMLGLLFEISSKPDPLAVPANAFKDIKARTTIKEGRQIFGALCKPPEICIGSGGTPMTCQ
jgi:hypothetical protein